MFGLYKLLEPIGSGSNINGSDLIGIQNCALEKLSTYKLNARGAGVSYIWISDPI